jgi:hypothetical protein
MAEAEEIRGASVLFALARGREQVIVPESESRKETPVPARRSG